MSQLNLFATSPKGLELLLKEELQGLGAQQVAEKLAGVKFTGDIEVAYKVCLWSRFANRVLLQLASLPASTPEELYKAVKSITWEKHMTLQTTFAVQFVSTQSKITHTLFGAQKVKDAIVDQFRDRYGDRPNVALEQPQVCIYVYLQRDIATIYLDLSGESLHKRGYRLEAGKAPLKENLAAAILQRVGWSKIAKANGALLDPMCGSGTIVIEAALMAADIAPGLLHNYFGFLGWKQHQPTLWQTLLMEAQARREVGLKRLPKIVGYDRDASVISIAFANIERAGLSGYVHVEKRDLLDFVACNNTTGIVVTNPPYGERLGEVKELESLYTLLGQRLKQAFAGWQAAVFTGNPDLGIKMGMRASKMYSLFNGALPCKLLIFTEIYSSKVDSRIP